MRVLITNASLGFVGGTETCTRDLALWLLDQGHAPIVYGPDHGEAAMQLRRRSVPVTDDLATISVAPDVIHGNSAVELMSALLHFPRTPGVFVCHGWYGPIARFPRIFRYVAVDDACADRLLAEHGLPADRVSVLHNAVDLKRFERRGPLPPKPKRALVFSNTAHELSHLPIVEEACRRTGIAVDVIGFRAGTAVADPEAILGDYDLVFGKARCALEAMATGAAVILCDAAGLGGLVRAADVDRLRRLNFGLRSMSRPVTVDALVREIESYDAADAEAVCDAIRSVASSEALHQSYLAMYDEVIEAAARETRDGDWEEIESRAAAEFIRYIMADRRRHEEGTNALLHASRRVLRVPLVGPLITRVARWMASKGNRGRIP